MKAILINSTTREFSEVETDGSDASLLALCGGGDHIVQGRLGDWKVKLAVVANPIAENRQFFTIEGCRAPFIGNGIVLGDSMTLNQVREGTHFFSQDEIISLAGESAKEAKRKVDEELERLIRELRTGGAKTEPKAAPAPAAPKPVKAVPDEISAAIGGETRLVLDLLSDRLQSK